MTNLLTALVLTLIVTNSTQIGTFTGNDSRTAKVLEDRYRTNTVAVFEFEGTKREVVLKSADGPVIRERKEWIEITMTNYTVPWKQFTLPPGMILTNGIIIAPTIDTQVSSEP